MSGYVEIEADRIKSLISQVHEADKLIDAIRKMDAREQYKQDGIPDIAFKMQDLHGQLNSINAEMRDIAEDLDIPHPDWEDEE